MNAVAIAGAATPDVLRLGSVKSDDVAALLARFDLTLHTLCAGQLIPGSYWGDDEAGLIGHTVYAREDTPIHSILHEACHAICMSPQRRRRLHTDAGGEEAEENAVCYLQLVLADSLACTDRAALCTDMDAWGYSFRLGSAAAWFRDDADDARAWLHRHNLLIDDAPTWRLRGEDRS